MPADSHVDGDGTTKSASDLDWDPAHAALLNLFLPGVGYIYMGRVFTGVSNLIASLLFFGLSWGCAIYVLTDPANYDPATLRYYSALFLFVLPIPTHIGMVVHPFSIARKKRAKLAAMADAMTSK